MHFHVTTGLFKMMVVMRLLLVLMVGSTSGGEMGHPYLDEFGNICQDKMETMQHVEYDKQIVCKVRWEREKKRLKICCETLWEKTYW